MRKDAVKTAMLKWYKSISAVHKYIFGFTFDDAVYAVMLTADEIDNFITIDDASRGAGYSMRFKPTVEMKLSLLKSAIKVCTIEFFEMLCEHYTICGYNRGDVFEALMSVEAEECWRKEPGAFWECPDVTIENIGYQVKFQGATFTNTKQMNQRQG